MVLSLILRHNIYFLTAVIVAVLSSLSLYNGYWVVWSYWYDNVVTSTSVKLAKNIYPFARYMTVSYTFANGSIFPETWTMNETEFRTLFPEEDYRSGYYAARRLKRRKDEEIFYRNYSSDEDLSLENAIDIASMTDMITYVDLKFLVDFTQDEIFNGYTEGDEEFEPFFYNLSKGLSAYEDRFYQVSRLSFTSELAALIDAFIENPFAEELVEKTLSKVIHPNFVHVLYPEMDNVTTVPVSFTVDRLTERSVQILIPFDFIQDMTAATIELGVMPLNRSAMPPPISGIHQSFSPFKVPGIIGTNLGSGDPVLRYPMLRSVMNFQNSGIYNSTDVYSEEKCRKCLNLNSVEHCQYKCLLDSIVDICHCVPFTYRRLYRDPGQNRLPYCTLKMYGLCIRLADYDPTRCDSEEEIIPCETHEYNRYTEVDGENLPDPNGTESEGRLYRFKFSVMCAKTTYVVFQEKFQESWMEMLGELGGNIGIFLSFSLYGVWQCVVLVYFAYERRKERKPNSQQAVGPWKLMSSWMKLLSVICIEDGPIDDDQRGNDQQIEELERKMQKLCLLYEFARKESEVVKIRMRKEHEEAQWKLESENQQLKKSSTELEKRIKVLEERFGTKENNRPKRQNDKKECKTDKGINS